MFTAIDRDVRTGLDDVVVVGSNGQRRIQAIPGSVDSATVCTHRVFIFRHSWYSATYL